jgi:hypothetical protein
MPLRRHFVNSAPQLVLSAGVDADDTVLTVASTTGYPEVPFIIAIGRGTAEHEVCLCTGKTSNSFTVTRGYDGTTGVAHSLGAVVEHTTAAIDYEQANYNAVYGPGDGESILNWMGI